MKKQCSGSSEAVVFDRSRSPASTVRKTGPPLVLLLAGTLAGCATYRRQPLSTGSTLQDRIPDLTIDPRQMPLPELAAHKFDPADGLA
jgi:hypothetical protein